MKAEFEDREIQIIAETVVAMLKPHLVGNRKAHEEILDVAGLAQFLKVEKSWIHQNHRALKIPSFRLGNQLRFRRFEVEKWTRAQS